MFGLSIDGQSIALQSGRFEDCLILKDGERVALAHIDCDWYRPVLLCLERMYPLLSIGGYLIIDDYQDYGGCKKAVHEFLARRHDLVTVSRESNLVLRREVG